LHPLQFDTGAPGGFGNHVDGETGGSSVGAPEVERSVGSVFDRVDPVAIDVIPAEEMSSEQDQDSRGADEQDELPPPVQNQALDHIAASVGRRSESVNLISGGVGEWGASADRRLGTRKEIGGHEARPTA
jgi:hypothetical protein